MNVDAGPIGWVKLSIESGLILALSGFLLPSILLAYISKIREADTFWVCYGLVPILVVNTVFDTSVLLNLWRPSVAFIALFKGLWLLLAVWVGRRCLSERKDPGTGGDAFWQKLSYLKLVKLFESRRFRLGLGPAPGGPIQLLDRYIKELAQTQKNLERSNAAQSNFLANMSHEVRTPLAGILGYSDQLLFDSNLREGHRESVELIKKCSIHLKFILDDILDVSKLQAGRNLVHRETCNFMSLLHEVVALTAHEVKEKSLNFQVRFQTLIPDRLVTDPLRVRQVLVNLLNNAVKFTDRGEIRLELQVTGLQESRTGTLEIIVSDTGPGIPDDFQPNLFQRFSQAESVTKIRHGGSGLGLFLSRSLARQLGGELQLLQSAPGKGSVFRFTLAIEMLDDSLLIKEFVYPQFQSDGPMLPNSIDGKLQNVSILVVEDGLDNQRIFLHFLQKAGAQVSVAGTGLAALEFLQDNPQVDLVLMDIQLPLLNGYEVTDRLRKQGFQKPIIAVTAHSLQGEKAACTQAGMDEVMSKPVDFEKLIQLIAQYVFRSHPPIKAAQVKAKSLGRVEGSAEDESQTKIFSRYHNNKIYQDIIIAFVREFDQRLDDIEGHMDRSDWEKLGFCLHQMKGAAGSYGYPLLSELATEMEVLLAQGQLDCLALQEMRTQTKRMRQIGVGMRQGLNSFQLLRAHEA